MIKIMAWLEAIYLVIIFGLEGASEYVDREKFIIERELNHYKQSEENESDNF